MTRATLQRRGLLDEAGRVTEAGEAWTDEQIAMLRRKVAEVVGERGYGRR